MRFSEIITERSLSDVGVRGGKFYLAAEGRHVDIPHFIKTGELPGVKGISSTKYIWNDFGPHMGRDLFFVMPAADVLRQNKMHRVGYDNPDKLIANNSKMLGRIMNIGDVAHAPGDNLVTGVFDKIPGMKRDLRGDPIAVTNRAQSIANMLRRGHDFDAEDRYGKLFKGVDVGSFGDYKSTGLRLSSYDDYANLYYQAAKAAGYYGDGFAKFFAPQNRSKWLPAIKAGILAQANVYADESEWVNEGSTFVVPKSSTILLSVPKQYWNGKPKMAMGFIAGPDGKPLPREKGGGTWSDFDTKYLDYYTNLVSAFANSDYKVQLLDANNVSNQLVRARAKRRNWT